MRIKKLWLTIILIGCCIFGLAACAEERLATGISLKEYSSEAPLEFAMGKFPYGDYTVSIAYTDGSTEELALTEDMISETDKLKFYQEGNHTITVAYKGAETSVEINVARNQFSENIQLNDFTATYNGKAFTVEVEGDIPGGTDILYPQGNTFQNAGSYDMTAILQCDGYVTKILSATVLIEKATYDVSNAQLYDRTVTYNKDAHSLAVKGQIIGDNGTEVYAPATLPQGVTVSYSITKVKDGRGEEIPLEKQQRVEENRAVDAGTYMVCAKYKGDASNYKAIPDSVAHLTIECAAYDLSKIEFVNKTVTYSGKAHSLGIPSNSKLPSDVELSYKIARIKDGEGNLVQDAPRQNGNSATDAGVYMVEAHFTIIGKNAENYKAIPFERAYLTIERAVYDLSGVQFFDEAVIYTGEPYQLMVSGKLPEGIEVSYQIEQVKDGAGASVSGDDKYQANTSVATNAGEYAVTASFRITDENVVRNYTVQPLEKTVTLTILRATYDSEMEGVQLESQTFDYEEGKTYEIVFEYDLPDGVSPQFTLTDENGKQVQGTLKTVTDEETGKTTYQYAFSVAAIGEYTCKVAFTHDNGNYEKITLTLTETIYLSDVA